MTTNAPVFPVPPLSPLALEALERAALTKFYDLNAEEFTCLVCVHYAEFLESTPDLRGRKPKGERLFKLFCAGIRATLTAASSQIERRPTTQNGLARALLWEHMRREGLANWQDFYGEGKRKPPKIMRLVDDFVHFVVTKSFERGAANHASDPAKVAVARRTIQEINSGARRTRRV